MCNKTRGIPGSFIANKSIRDEEGIKFQAYL